MTALATGCRRSAGPWLGMTQTMLFVFLLAALVPAGGIVYTVLPTGKIYVAVAEILFAAAVLADRNAAFAHLAAAPRSAYLLAFAWLVWSSLAVVQAEHVAIALVRQSEWLAHGVFGLSMWVFLASYPERARHVAGLVVAGFVIYCALLLAFWLRQVEPESYRVVHGLPSFGHMRTFGYFVLVALILCYQPALRGARAGGVAPIAVAAACATVAWCFLFWAGGRGPLVAFLASAAVLALAGVHVVRKETVAVTAASAPLGALLSMPISFPGLGIGRLLRTAGGLDGTGADSLDSFSSGRIDLWLDSLPGSAREVLVGIGPDNFVFHVAPEHSHLAQPHNVVLQTVLEWGMPGALLFFTLLAWGLMAARRGLRGQADEGWAPRAAGLWLVVALAGFALVDGTLYHSYPLMFAAAALALALQPRVADGPATAGRRLPRGAVAACAPVVIAVMALHGASQHALYAEGTPQPESWRVRALKAFPSAAALPGFDWIAMAWSFEWADRGEAGVCEWMAWAHSQSRWPWQMPFIYGTALIDAGRGEAGRALLREAMEGVSPRVQTRAVRELPELNVPGALAAGRICEL